ncbi:serine hydrolase [Rugosimonospora africana]|uniref:Serine hydrolase n=1 Tax=Rugosimonospora africana TaxID=556532 RepID=A0A8J3QTQ5_9ACTN|nr:serine hydrolase [Rugosimonospora africana]
MARGVDAVAAEFAAVGVTGRVHVRDVDDDRSQVALDADERVVLASVFKVLLVLEYARQVVAGQLDPTERVRVGAADRLGGVGTAGCENEVDISWRDLAMFAMSLSDNTAADLLLRRVGLDTVQTLTTELGLASTRITGGPRQLVASMFADLGAADEAEFAAIFPALRAEQLAGLTVLDPRRTSATTPRDMTRLLSLIWRDQAGPAPACAQVRRLMSQQVSWHRLAAGFDDEVAVAAKSGTVLGVRNEIGVVRYPDGRRYAVAVFTSDGWGVRRPDVDRAIGRAARHAVDRLRNG